MATDFDTMSEWQRGYQAAKAGQVSLRHNRYWIDTPGCAELCRPDVVKGIEAYEVSREARELYEFASGR
jgi:hypothetical protein